MLLVFLQCAWRPGGVFKSREYWMTALWESHTGRRLKEMIPEGVAFYVDNSTDKIGTTADAIFPPDPEYMSSVIKQVNPDVILACGEVAQAGLNKLGVAYIEAPHPAYRALSKKRTAGIKEQVAKALQN